MRKYILSTLFFSLATTLTYAHEPYVAPLSYITSNTQIPVISAYAEQALQAEYALKQPTFNIIQPDQSKISITSESTLKSASLIDLPLPQKGTYQISSKVSFPLKYVQHNKEWKTFFDMPADQAKDIKERDYVIPADFKKVPTLVEVTREWSIQSYVSKKKYHLFKVKLMHQYKLSLNNTRTNSSLNNPYKSQSLKMVKQSKMLSYLFALKDKKKMMPLKSL